LVIRPRYCIAREIGGEIDIEIRRKVARIHRSPIIIDPQQILVPGPLVKWIETILCYIPAYIKERAHPRPFGQAIYLQPLSIFCLTYTLFQSIKMQFKNIALAACMALSTSVAASGVSQNATDIAPSVQKRLVQLDLGYKKTGLYLNALVDDAGNLTSSVSTYLLNILLSFGS
jgi:hypothetical protein